MGIQVKTCPSVGREWLVSEQKQCWERDGGRSCQGIRTGPRAEGGREQRGWGREERVEGRKGAQWDNIWEDPLDLEVRAQLVNLDKTISRAIEAITAFLKWRMYTYISLLHLTLITLSRCSSILNPPQPIKTPWIPMSFTLSFYWINRQNVKWMFNF